MKAGARSEIGRVFQGNGDELLRGPDGLRFSVDGCIKIRVLGAVVDAAGHVEHLPNGDVSAVRHYNRQVFFHWIVEADLAFIDEKQDSLPGQPLGDATD